MNAPEQVTLANADLYCGDCLEVMPRLPPLSVDAVITDPPYMIGAVSVGNAGAKAGGWADMENAAWWFAEWLKQAKRLLKQDGYACVFGNWRSLPTLLYAFSKAQWPVDSLLIWDKEWIGPAGPRQLRPTYELVLFAGMPDARIDNRSASDIYRCKWMAGNSKLSDHAAEKPVPLMQHLIQLVTKPGDTVLDPFMGSGTTGIAAHLEGRRFIGIEREREFHSMAAGRIGNGQAQGGLFMANARAQPRRAPAREAPPKAGPSAGALGWAYRWLMIYASWIDDLTLTRAQPGDVDDPCRGCCNECKRRQRRCGPDDECNGNNARNECE